MDKAFSCGKTGKRPEKGRTGKRANEIECPEKGKGKAPDLKSEASLGGLPFIERICWELGIPTRLVPTLLRDKRSQGRQILSYEAHKVRSLFLEFCS